MGKTLRAKDLEPEYGIRLHQAYKLAREKKIPAVRIGRMLIFDKAEIDAWFRRHKIKEKD